MPALSRPHLGHVLTPAVRSPLPVEVSWFCACPFAAAPQAAARAHAWLAFSRQHLDFTLGHALRPGHQCLGLSGGGFFSLASGFDAGGSLGQAGAAPTTGSAPPRSCASTSEGSTFLASISATVHASPRLSRSPGPPPWSIDESSNADAPPDFSRSSMGKSGGFKGSGATGFDGVPFSGSTLSRRIIA